MPDIKINQETCVHCGACVALCTGRVYGQTGRQVDAVAPENCWHCGHCVAVCPADAIEHSRFPLPECPLLEPLPSLDELVMAFRERRSVRLYQDRAVPRQVIGQLVDIARWVPSASNKQPVDWLVLDDPERIAALSDQMVSLFGRAARLLLNPVLNPLWKWALGRQADRLANSATSMLQQHAQGRDPFLFNAPAVLIAHVPKGSPFGRDDAVYAAYNLMLAAQRLGLGTCQIGFFKIALNFSPRLRRSLQLPRGRRPEVILTLGYPKYRFRRAIPRRDPRLLWNGEKADQSRTRTGVPNGAQS